MSKYNDLMENIVVTEEMKNRILQNIEKEMDVAGSDDKTVAIKTKETEKKKSGVRIIAYRRWGSIVAAALALVAVGITARVVIGNHDMGSSVSETPAMSEAAADAAAATDAKETGSPKLQPVETAGDRENALAPATHAFEAAGDDAEYIDNNNSGAVIKELPGEITVYSEISGDKAQYEVVETEQVDGFDVTYRGNGTDYSSAMWYDGKNTYTVYYESPVSKDVLTDTVRAVMHKR